MSKDSDKSKELESEASQMIDRAASDEGKLDKAAELLAEAEKLKGPIVKEDSDKKVKGN